MSPQFVNVFDADLAVWLNGCKLNTVTTTDTFNYPKKKKRKEKKRKEKRTKKGFGFLFFLSNEVFKLCDAFLLTYLNTRDEVFTGVLHTDQQLAESPFPCLFLQRCGCGKI